MILKIPHLFFLMGALGLSPCLPQCETYYFSHEQIVKSFKKYVNVNIIEQWNSQKDLERAIKRYNPVVLTSLDYSKSFENLLIKIFGSPCRNEENPTIVIDIPSKFCGVQRTDHLLWELQKKLLPLLFNPNPPYLSLRINIGPFPTDVLAYHEVVYDPFEDCFGI